MIFFHWSFVFRAVAATDDWKFMFLDSSTFSGNTECGRNRGTGAHHGLDSRDWIDNIRGSRLNHIHIRTPLRLVLLKTSANEFICLLRLLGFHLVVTFCFGLLYCLDGNQRIPQTFVWPRNISAQCVQMVL